MVARLGSVDDVKVNVLKENIVTPMDPSMPSAPKKPPRVYCFVVRPDP